MKKLFLFVMMSIMTITAFAQIKSVDLKADLRHNFGAGIGVTTAVTDRIDFAPSFNWYFIKDAYAMNVDADFHYNLPIQSDFTFYPVLGVAVWNQGGNARNNWTRLGINFGGGVKYEVVDRVAVFAECKYQWFNKMDDVYLSLGVNFGI